MLNFSAYTSALPDVIEHRSAFLRHTKSRTFVAMVTAELPTESRLNIAIFCTDLTKNDLEKRRPDHRKQTLSWKVCIFFLIEAFFFGFRIKCPPFD